MNTPPKDQTQTEAQAVAPVATSHSGKGWWYVAIAVIIVGGVYIYLAARNVTTIPDTTAVTTTNSSASTEDPITQQLQSVSDKTDPTTLKSEVSSTDLSDVATELDTVTVETSGL